MQFNDLLIGSKNKKPSQSPFLVNIMGKHRLKDSDGDYVVDFLDCQPYNKYKDAPLPQTGNIIYASNQQTKEKIYTGTVSPGGFVYAGGLSIPVGEQYSGQHVRVTEYGQIIKPEDMPKYEVIQGKEFVKEATPTPGPVDTYREKAVADLLAAQKKEADTYREKALKDLALAQQREQEKISKTIIQPTAIQLQQQQAIKSKSDIFNVPKLETQEEYKSYLLNRSIGQSQPEILRNLKPMILPYQTRGTRTDIMPTTDYNKLVKESYEEIKNKQPITYDLSISKAGSYTYPKGELKTSRISLFTDNTISHEIGHKLDFEEKVIRDYSKYKEASKNYVPDIIENIGYNKGNIGQEYYARAFANYIKNPEKFKNKYPEIAKEFERRLEIENQPTIFRQSIQPALVKVEGEPQGFISFLVKEIEAPRTIIEKKLLQEEKRKENEEANLFQPQPIYSSIGKRETVTYGEPKLSIYGQTLKESIQKSSLEIAKTDIKQNELNNEYTEGKINYNEYIRKSDELTNKLNEKFKQIEKNREQEYKLKGVSERIIEGIPRDVISFGLYSIPYYGGILLAKDIITQASKPAETFEAMKEYKVESAVSFATFVLLGRATGKIKGIKESAKISEALKESTMIEKIKKGYLTEKSLDAYKLSEENKLELKRLKEKGATIREVEMNIKPKKGFESYTPDVKGRILEAINKEGDTALRIAVGEIEAKYKGKSVSNDILAESIYKINKEGNIKGYTELIQKLNREPMLGISGGYVYPKVKRILSKFYEESRITGFKEEAKTRLIKSESESYLISKQKYGGKPFGYGMEDMFRKQGKQLTSGEFIEKQKLKKTKGLKIGKEGTSSLSPIDYAKRLSKEGKIIYEEISKERMNELRNLGLDTDITAGQIKGKFSNEPDLNIIFVRKDLPKFMKQKKVAHELIHYKTEGLFDINMERNLPYEKRPSEIIAIKNEQRFAEKGFKVKTGDEIGLLYGEKYPTSEGFGYTKIIKEAPEKIRPSKKWNLFKEEEFKKPEYKQSEVSNNNAVQILEQERPSMTGGQGLKNLPIQSSSNLATSSFVQELPGEFSKGYMEKGFFKGVGLGIVNGLNNAGIIDLTKKSETSERIKPSTSSVLIGGSLEIEKTREKEREGFGTGNIQISSLGLREEESFNYAEIQKQPQRQETKQETKLISRMGQPARGSGFYLFPEEFTFIPKIPTETKEKKKKKLGKKYIAELRRKGKFTEVSKPTSLSEAIGIGISRTKATLGASFRIKESDTGKIKGFNLSSPEFRPSKREQGVAIQKRSFRLGTLFERREIQRARKR